MGISAKLPSSTLTGALPQGRRVACKGVDSDLAGCGADTWDMTFKLDTSRPAGPTSYADTRAAEGRPGKLPATLSPAPGVQARVQGQPGPGMERTGPFQRSWLSPGRGTRKEDLTGAIASHALQVSPAAAGATLNDPGDPFSVQRKIPAGVHHGEIVFDDPIRRNLMVLGPELAASYGAAPGDLAIANYVEERADGTKYPGVLIIPQAALDHIEIVAPEESVMFELRKNGLVGFSHGQAYFKFSDEHLPRVVPQRPDAADQTPVQVREVVFSGEATSPKDPTKNAAQYDYDALKGMISGNYVISDTLRSASIAKEMFRSEVRPAALHISDEDKRRVFEAAVLGAIEKPEPVIYRTLTESCSTRLFDALDRALHHRFNLLQQIGAAFQQNPHNLELYLKLRGIGFDRMEPWTKAESAAE